MSIINDIKKVTSPRHCRVTNSLGVYDAYKYIRKNKWFDIGQSISEHDFYFIIREINKHLADQLLSNRPIRLPQNMGLLELRKRIPSITLENGKIKTNLPVDWDKTLKLWASDIQAYNNKTLVRHESKEVFKVYYNKTKAIYNNKHFYTFTLNRDLKLALKEKVRNNEVDAFLL